MIFPIREPVMCKKLPGPVICECLLPGTDFRYFWNLERSQGVHKKQLELKIQIHNYTRGIFIEYVKGRALCNGLEQVTSQGSITQRNRSTCKYDDTHGTPASVTLIKVSAKYKIVSLGRKHGRTRLGLTDAISG